MSAETLRRAASLMREEWRVDDRSVTCRCEDDGVTETDQWFDRSVCPDPCASMHDICAECGRIKGRCPVAVESADNRNRLASSWLAVADWLDAVAARMEMPHNHGWKGSRQALAVARAYLGGDA